MVCETGPKASTSKLGSRLTLNNPKNLHMSDNTNTKTASTVIDWKQDLGPLKPYFMDPTVSEIMVNGPNAVFVEKNGVVTQVDAKFTGIEAINKLVQSMVVVAGKELNRKIPVADLRLPDGSRASCVVPPASIDGPILTIRKFMVKVLNLDQLIKNGALDDKVLYFLHRAVISKQNILVSGGTGSGKTTLLNLLGSFIPTGERVLTIEDTPELAIPHKNLVRFECRPPKNNDPGISVQELLRAALRLRPDRIIVGECRGAEAYDMIQAMNTGHEGSMATVHSNSCADAARRLEGMILRTETNVNAASLRKDIFETISIIIQCERSLDGKRRVVEVAETIPGTSEIFPIFTYSPMAGFAPTGNVPKFIDTVKDGHKLFPEGFFDAGTMMKIASGS